jgi:hypothetical protein
MTPVAAKSANRKLAEYYHWEETGLGIGIYMHSGMADRLQAEVLRGADSDPDGGREVGGILLGRTEEDGGKTITFIDDFVAVPCSYHDGPLYDISDKDTINLETALLRTALAGCDSPNAPSILGYYRSHMRDGLCMSAADLQVIDSYFQTPASVFLVAKVVPSAKACTAGFFFWEGGRIQSEFSSLEVALARTSFQPAPADIPDPNDDSNDTLLEDLPSDLAELFRRAALPGPSSVPVPESEPCAQAAQPGKTQRVWPGQLLRVGTLSIATAALVVSVATYFGAPRPREQAAASTPGTSVLGLQVEQNPPNVLLKWNRNSHETVSAHRATLYVRDGKTETIVALDRAELARGSYLYGPASGDIQFRLEVYGADDGSVAQSIRVLLPKARSAR